MKELSNTALDAATSLFVNCSLGISNHYAQAMLRNWWDETGKMWLTSTSQASSAEDGEDEFAMDGEVQEPDPDEKPEDPVAVMLANVEVESDLHKEVALLVDATLEAKEKTDAHAFQDGPAPVAKDASEAKPNIAGMPLTLVGILQRAKIADFSAKDDTESACISRVKKLYEPMKGFVVAVREEEGFAPKLALETDGEELSSHNFMQRQLARARQDMDLNHSRRSRMQLWMGFAERCVAATKSKESDGEAPVARVPNAFKPSCVLKQDGKRDYQVLCARSCPDDRLMLVLVQAVYRGALKKGGTRAQRATKPHHGVLPANLCSRVHACLLAPSTDSTWFYCNNTSFLLPYDVAADQILYEVTAEHFTTMEDENLQLWVNFKPGVLTALVNLQKDIPLLDTAAVSKKQALVETKPYTHLDFAVTQTGRNNIKEYMEGHAEALRAVEGQATRGYRRHVHQRVRHCRRSMGRCRGQEPACAAHAPEGEKGRLHLRGCLSGAASGSAESGKRH